MFLLTYEFENDFFKLHTSRIIVNYRQRATEKVETNLHSTFKDVLCTEDGFQSFARSLVL